MKFPVSAVILALALAAQSASALESSGNAGSMQHSASCGLPMGEGTIADLDIKSSKATIDHVPIIELGWGAMKMSFKAGKGVDLSAFAPGDRVHFLLKQDTKKKTYSIEAICGLDVSEGMHEACMTNMHHTAMSIAGKAGMSCAEGGMDHSMDHGKMKPEGHDHH